jgi:hypothetical protein
MKGWYVNDEFEKFGWKGPSPHFKVLDYPNVRLEKMRKTMKNLSQ